MKSETDDYLRECIMVCNYNCVMTFNAFSLERKLDLPYKAQIRNLGRSDGLYKGVAYISVLLCLLFIHVIAV